MKKHAIAIVALVLLQASCSTTPGDAALHSNHVYQAAELYRLGAEQGDAAAALKLGLLINGGAIAGDEFGNAGSWFEKACELGDTVGCHNAGVCFEYGQSGLKKDYEHARSRYLRAAERGYMQSQYNLGSLYANRYFDDTTEGLKWLLAAQKMAHTCQDELCKWILADPPGHIERLKSQMTSEQIMRAKNEAAALAH
ncbi:sel1 repeat family protein [Permianibacter sp. IMCC34836]|uniref:tetratricopeptide repeat protein n=1 Tax=Permianibacter fluminis TaxID=2738515 RepID=UPI0015567E23|nr:SEL1-like repeat protein [Permianibacter fluminis]NQD36238.1 sel1 repeat family protein [Permianibacter fluminis]